MASEPLVTDEDREKAAALLWGTTAASRERTEDIAAALAAEREKARAPFLALLAAEESEAQEHYAITVEIPMRIGTEMVDKMFSAVADAAHDAEPDERDWDVFVHGSGPSHQGVPLHLLRRAAES